MTMATTQFRRRRPGTAGRRRDRPDRPRGRGSPCEPGDIISTGTPARTPQAQAAHVPLALGETVTVRVTGLGSLPTMFASMEES